MFGFLRRRHPARRAVRATVAAALVGVSLVSTVVMPQVANAYILSPIDGSYLFNANGWTGTLTVYRAENLDPIVVMDYDELGSSEQLSGTWSPTTGTLTVYRPLSGGVSQTYVLYLGSYNPSSPVFGGYFTESDVPGMRYGAFADDFVVQGAVRPSSLPANGVKHVTGTAVRGATTVTPSANTVTAPAIVHPDNVPLPTYLIGLYWFDGNGWDGQMGIDFANCAFPPGDMMLYYNALGNREDIEDNSWDASTGTLTFVRSLSDGATQTYTLYEGTHVAPSLQGEMYLAQSVMFGGYFTESDTGSTRYAAYASFFSGAVGC